MVKMRKLAWAVPAAVRAVTVLVCAAIVAAQPLRALQKRTKKTNCLAPLGALWKTLNILCGSIGARTLSSKNRFSIFHWLL